MLTAEGSHMLADLEDEVALIIVLNQVAAVILLLGRGIARKANGREWLHSLFRGQNSHRRPAARRRR
jgi:hypothetical protein